MNIVNTIMTDTNRTFKNANEAYTQKNLERAFEAVNSALSFCPESKEANTLAKTIKKAQSTAKNHIQKANAASNAKKFEEAAIEIRNAEQIWPKAPGLGEAMMTLLEAKKALRRHKIKWVTGTIVTIVIIYLLSMLVFFLINRKYANNATHNV